MTDAEKAVAGDETSYTQHRLYTTAVQKMADGDDAGAVEALERLSKLYPEEKDLQSLLLRVQLRATFGGGDYIPVDHAPPRPVLRNLVVILLSVTVLLVLVAAGTAINHQILEPQRQAQQREAYLRSLWDDCNSRLERGDLVGARECGEKLQLELPGNQPVEDFLQVVNQRQGWEDLYAECVSASNRGEWPLALDLCYRVPPESGKHGAAQLVIQDLQKRADLEAAWEEAQALIGAGDYRGAISTLSWIRSQNPDFRQDQVEQRLFELHRELALQLVDEAGGNADLLREATGHLSEALALRPASQDLIEERNLAVGFVAGAEAYDREDWPSAAAKWEPVYAARPDYQNEALRRRLREVYPRAAEQLVAEANGSVRQLSRALSYLDRALEFDPGNEALLLQRDQIGGFLEGLEAFSSEQWDLAIYTWGPLYAIRSDFQGGVLEENLKLACASSEAPDENLCPP